MEYIPVLPAFIIETEKSCLSWDFLAQFASISVSYFSQHSPQLISKLYGSRSIALKALISAKMILRRIEIYKPCPLS